jgi:hypothetical protein
MNSDKLVNLLDLSNNYTYKKFYSTVPGGSSYIYFCVPISIGSEQKNKVSNLKNVFRP